jgi:hypothetical protein
MARLEDFLHTFYKALKTLPKVQRKKANNDPQGEWVYTLPPTPLQLFAATADSAPPQRNNDDLR